MTDQNRWLRRIPAVAGVGAIIAMGFTAACASEEGQAPETTPTTTTPTTPAPVSPTEKAPRIGSSPDPFTPTVHAPPPDTATPGRHRGPRGQ